MIATMYYPHFDRLATASANSNAGADKIFPPVQYGTPFDSQCCSLINMVKKQ